MNFIPDYPLADYPNVPYPTSEGQALTPDELRACLELVGPLGDTIADKQTRALAGTTIPSHPATSSSLPPTAHTDLPQHSYASNDAPASRLTFPGGSHIDLQEFAAQEAYNVQLAAFSNVFEPSEAAELTFDTNALPLALPANALHLNIYPFAQGLPPAFTPPLTQSSSPESIYSSLNGTPSPLATPYFPDVRVVSPNIGDYNSAPHMQAETIAGPSSTPGQYMPLFVPGHGYYLVSSAACIPHSDVHCAVPPPMPDSLYPSQEPASQIPLPPPQLHAKRKAKRHNKPKKPSTRSTPKSDALGQKKPKAKLQCTVEGCSVTFTTPKDRMRHFKEQHKEDQDVYYCPNPRCSSNTKEEERRGFSRKSSVTRHLLKKPDCQAISSMISRTDGI